MPVGTPAVVVASTALIGTARVTGALAMTREVGVPASATLPQVWHSPHRPTQRWVVQPHSLHR